MGPAEFWQEQWAVTPWVVTALEMMLPGIREKAFFCLPSALMNKYLHVNNHLKI